MVVADDKGIIRLVNAAAADMFGYARAEMLGLSIESLLPMRYRDAHPAHRASYFHSPSRRAMGIGQDLYARRQDGSEFPVEVGLNPIATATGTLVLSVIVDITERKRIAAQVQASLALQAAIVSSSDSAIISESVSGSITSWNPAAERLFGYSAEEAIGRSIVDLVVPDGYFDEEHASRQQMQDDGKVKTFETRRRHKDGHLVDVSVTLFPLLDSRGRPAGTAVFKTDISARQWQEQRFRTVVEALPTGIVIVDRSGAIQLVNPHAEKMFGYSRDELIGETVDILLPTALRDSHAEHRNAYFGAPSARAMGNGRDLLCRRKDGLEFSVEIGLTPIGTGHGTAVLAVVTDISERVRDSQQLAEQRDELKRSNDELTAFAYVASHDLKSPLRGIDQLAMWIEEDLKNEQLSTIPEHMRLMQSRIRRMENLLDDLLAYSRAGRVEGRVSPVVVADLARGIFDMLSPPPGISLELPGDLPIFTTLNTPFEQVLRNLFSNAIKHHDRDVGRITFQSKSAGERFLEFTVRDDGPGIPPQYHERVFGMFQTLRPRDEIEGSGMGLALVKKLVECYGGTIGIDSDGVRGCSIHFTWPVAISRGSRS